MDEIGSSLKVFTYGGVVLLVKKKTSHFLRVVFFLQKKRFKKQKTCFFILWPLVTLVCLTDIL